MIKKQGITITMLVITIIILIILAGTISISVYSTLNYSRLSSWANEMMYIQDVVDEELNESSILTDTLETISVDVSVLTVEQREEQFEGETITVGNLIELNILDLGKLGITDTMFGNLDSEADVYAVSMTTGRVYYAQGFEIDDKVYFTLTDGLKQRFELTSTANLNSVVFMPNVVGYTNEPIKVTVKIPQTFSNIAISTSNDKIQVGSQTVVDNLYEYVINNAGVEGNYTITVSYNDGVQNKTVNYEVKGYDVTKPTIQEINRDNWLYKQTEDSKVEYLINITATDESGIKQIKYAAGKIEQDKAKEYFTGNGNDVVDGKINLDKKLIEYTIYAEDKAGNFTTTVVNINKLKGWVKDGFTVVKGDQVLEIGDVVNYDAGVATYTAGWKVLGADDAGNLLIMSAGDVKTGHTIGYESTMTDSTRLTESRNDWLNGIRELNSLCEEYGHGKGTIGNSRSITAKDINIITGYDPTTYQVGEVYQYGNEVTYAWDTTDTSKITYKGTLNNKTGSVDYSGDTFTWYDSKTEKFVSVAKGEKTVLLPTIKSTNYYYDASELTTISKTDNAKAYSMMFGDDDSYYWLASTYDRTFTYGVLSGFMYVVKGVVNYAFLLDSMGVAYSSAAGVRAVVTLSYDTNFTGSSETGWSY